MASGRSLVNFKADDMANCTKDMMTAMASAPAVLWVLRIAAEVERFGSLSIERRGSKQPCHADPGRMKATEACSMVKGVGAGMACQGRPYTVERPSLMDPEAHTPSDTSQLEAAKLDHPGLICRPGSRALVQTR